MCLRLLLLLLNSRLTEQKHTYASNCTFEHLSDQVRLIVGTLRRIFISVSLFPWNLRILKRLSVSGNVGTSVIINIDVHIHSIRFADKI